MPGNAASGMTGDISQLLLGICAGALFAMAAAILRVPRATARWTGFAFFFCSALFAITLWNDQTTVLPAELHALVSIMAMTCVAWFWLMVMALFGDVDRFRPAMFLAPAVMLLCGITTALQLDLVAIRVAATAAQVTLAVWSILIVMRSWKDDLVESRRRLRGPLMVAVGLHILSISGFDVWEIFSTVPDWYPMLNAGLFASVVLYGALAFLDPREAMFGSHTQPIEPRLVAEPSVQPMAPANGHANGHHSTPLSSPPALDRASKADLDRLETLMSRDQVWKEEGLTIASLALRASIPETQLRRLINDCLGYRNFPSYVNAHRIAAAKLRLADPGEARISISTIAYDIGFASLGPFNRAFKEEAGVSPSEWRRKSLGIGSPISEDA
jgi:AraC-like DNA-binding protein